MREFYRRPCERASHARCGGTRAAIDFARRITCRTLEPDERMEHPDRILVIQLQQLGDVVLSSALLEDLREAFPEATIDFLTRAGAAQLVQGNPFVTDLLVYDRERPLREALGIRRRRYQWVIDIQSSPRTAPLTLISGARRRVGWKIRGPWRLAYTDHVSRRMHDDYIVRQRQHFLEHLGVPTRPRVPRIFLTPDERREAGTVLEAAVTGLAGPRVGLVVSSRIASTRWPAERYAELAARLGAEGTAVVVLGTVGDADLVQQVMNGAPSARRLDVPELRRFAAVIAALDVFVSGDTGPAHIAMAVGTPTVTIYGATRATHWNPGLPTTVAVSSPRASCTPCRERLGRGAPGHTCIFEVGVDEVHAAIRALSHGVAEPDHEH